MMKLLRLGKEEPDPEIEVDFPAATKVVGDIEDAKESKSYVELVWDYCLEFLEGNQWLDMGYKDRQLMERRARRSGRRITVNLLLNLYRNLQSRLAMSFPGLTVLPASPSTEDITKAKCSEISTRYWWQKQKVNYRGRELVSWLVATGNAAWHHYWDPKKDDIQSRVVQPYDFFVEAGVDVLEESRWRAVRSFSTKKALLDCYGKDPKLVKRIKKLDESTEPVRRKQYSATSQHSSGTGVGAGRVEVYEIYWNDGRRAVVTGDFYLWKGKWDLPFNPVEFFRYTEVPGSIWGVGALESVIDLNYLYNRARSQLVEQVELTSNPMWWVPKGAGVNVRSFTARAGGVRKYGSAAGPPILVPPPALPPQIFDNIQRLHAEILDVAGVHSTSLGKRAIGISSGRAIKELSEQDQSQLSVTQETIEEGIERIVSVVLSLQKQNYTEGKMMRMVDHAGGLVWKQISQTDLVNEPDIIIQAGTLFRDEAEMRDEKVRQLLEMQLISPEDALDELTFRTGHMKTLQKISEMSHAQELLQAAQMGFQVQVYATEDMQVYEKVWGEFIRSADYYRLPDQIPDRSVGGMMNPKEYIHQVYTDIMTAGMPDEVNAVMGGLVHPRTPSGPEDSLGPRTPEENAAAQQARREVEATSPPLADGALRAPTTSGGALG